MHLHVFHATPQARLYCVWIPSENPHYHRPTQARKHRPGIPLDRLSQISSYAYTTFAFLLNRQFRQCKHHSCKHIDDDLLIDTALYAATKYQVATCEARKEAVGRMFFAIRRDMAQEYHRGLVGDSESRKVARVYASGFEDQAKLLPKP